MDRKQQLLEMGLIDPRDCGASEYSAIFECLEEGLESLDDEEDWPGDEAPPAKQHVESMLDEFIEWATSAKGRMKETA